MKVLFVCSGNVKKFGISPIVVNQAKSLEKLGIEISFFSVQGKGILNYLRSIRKLRIYSKKNKFDLIHAHYSYCGFLAAISFINKPIVVSLMGSDTMAGIFKRVLIRFFNYMFWKTTIVKSKNMLNSLRLRNVYVIPNGVDIDVFPLVDKSNAQKILGFDNERKNIIFVADPARIEKNYTLAVQAVKLLNNTINSKLIVVFDKEGVDHNLIHIYMNAADALVLTSLHEGSPNVIKEAMACNCPIVSTDVGDVKEVIGETEGCFISSFEAKDIATKLQLAINFGRTKGRQNISKLESHKIAKEIEKIYQQTVTF
jgi:glycosyltransferase involved in cell wall biosynthesis